MKNKKIKWLLLIVLGLMSWSISLPVSAEENVANFGVKPILPDNQMENIGGYFDLIVTPDLEQTLQIEISNSSDEDRVFEVQINPAMTSDGGTIDYSQTEPRLDDSLPFDIRQFLTVTQNEIEIPAHQSIVVPVKLVIPTEKFSGRVLAGIHVLPKDISTTNSKDENSLEINNRFAYNIAVSLREELTIIEPDLKLLEGQVSAVNASPAVQFLFQNPMGTIIPNLVFTSTVYYDDQLYIDNTSKEFLVAPNSNFHLNLDLAGDKAKAGDYHAEIVAKSGDQYEWHFTYDFSIAKKQADEVNESSIFAVKDNHFPWLTLLLVVAIVILLFLIFFLIFWKRRKKEEDEVETATH
ncbi:DUF916 and DUF3324 domain-containing protein [Enterococcus timonensis]|uniref:DUF916 and DUF3324 domain-containing protein n=1 Tax=Enterococcus timonensis TaxID=1852364 RepID=UPI000B0D35C1|nr:DUF916 and DUF3324 domain-containing protein [Enterococcus timonensis]